MNGDGLDVLGQLAAEYAHARAPAAQGLQTQVREDALDDDLLQYGGNDVDPPGKLSAVSDG